MSSDYVRVTFIGLRAPGDTKALPPTNDDIRAVLFVGDRSELDIVLDDIRSITVEDISAAEVRDWREAPARTSDQGEGP